MTSPMEGLAVSLAVTVVRRVMDTIEPHEPDAVAMIADPRARAFAIFMCARHNARLHVKDVALMRVAAAGFDVADLFVDGVPTGDAFIHHFGTTIGPEIFVPEEALKGDGRGLIVLLTHEIEHVAQFYRDHVAFVWLYATEPEARAGYEANACGAGLEAAHALGMTITPPPVPDLVASYHVRAEDQQLATVMIESFAASVSSGVPTTLAGRDAVAWLRSHP